MILPGDTSSCSGLPRRTPLHALGLRRRIHFDFAKMSRMTLHVLGHMVISIATLDKSLYRLEGTRGGIAAVPDGGATFIAAADCLSWFTAFMLCQVSANAYLPLTGTSDTTEEQKRAACCSQASRWPSIQSCIFHRITAENPD